MQRFRISLMDPRNLLELSCKLRTAHAHMSNRYIRTPHTGDHNTIRLSRETQLSGVFPPLRATSIHLGNCHHKHFVLLIGQPEMLKASQIRARDDHILLRSLLPYRRRNLSSGLPLLLTFTPLAIFAIGRDSCRRCRGSCL